jgi:hypothetical protein
MKVAPASTAAKALVLRAVLITMVSDRWKALLSRCVARATAQSYRVREIVIKGWGATVATASEVT